MGPAAIRDPGSTGTARAPGAAPADAAAVVQTTATIVTRNMNRPHGATPMPVWPAGSGQPDLARPIWPSRIWTRPGTDAQPVPRNPTTSPGGAPARQTHAPARP